MKMYKLTCLFFVFVLFIVYSMASCVPLNQKIKTSTKQVVSVDNKFETHIDSTKHLAKEEMSSKETNTNNIHSLEYIEGKTAEWEFDLEYYDTEKPIDKVTGKAPLKSKLVVHKKSLGIVKSNSRDDLFVNDKSKSNIETVENTNVKKSNVVKQKVNTSTKTEITPLKSYFIWFVIIGLIVILYFIWKIRKTSILSFFIGLLK
jgi:hypothetical protein